jgi:hypothetical protein
VAAAAIAVTGGFAIAGSAGAGGGGAETKVTIKAPSEIFGKVKSPNLERCAEGRKVKVFRQKGARGGGDDIKVGTDNAQISGEDGAFATWSIGNPGVPEGKKVYAKAGRIEGCQKDSSRTVIVGG